MPPHDRLMLLFCLSKDADPAIRSEALSSLETLPEDIIDEYKNSTDTNVVVLNALSLLSQKRSAVILETAGPVTTALDHELDVSPDQPDDDADLEEKDPVKEESEEFLSKYKTAQIMGIGEKIKMALSGDKEWRSILVKDSNKLVSGSVIKNPRITEGEIHTLIKSGSPNDEIMRLICANKEWIKSYKIRKALIENNRTPVQNAMRYLGTMDVKDMAAFAKSKNISSVISTMAKRLLLNRKR